jgi:hypothetical protein
MATQDISFNCPHCNQHLAVDQAGTGTTVSCPSCNEQIEILGAVVVPHHPYRIPAPAAVKPITRPCQIVAMK